MTDYSDLLARIGGYLAARPQYARTFYADHPEVMLKEAADEIAKLRGDRDCLKLLSDEQAVDQAERRAEITQLQRELAKLRAENERLVGFTDKLVAEFSVSRTDELQRELAKLRAENEQLAVDLQQRARDMMHRDSFILAKGLLQEFAATLPPDHEIVRNLRGEFIAPPSPEVR